jgi:transcriptional regulator GlxA family with amidase domain
LLLRGEYLRKTSNAARRIGSVCGGAFALAAAGLLDGRRATTHWYFCQQNPLNPSPKNAASAALNPCAARSSACCVFRRKSIANASTSPNQESITMNQLLNRRDFVKVATAATINAGIGVPQENQEKEKIAGNKQPLEIAVYLYPGMTAFDAVCPYDILSSGIPNSTVRFVAKERGLVRMDSRMLSLHADYAIREINSADILLLPGGGATPAQMQDQELLAWVRRIHEKSKWTTSVCTGSLILAAAGLLKGLEATTHWVALENLAMFGAKPSRRRVVKQGKIITAAGVSAGIDMALSLVAMECGEEQAKAVQLTIEYDPQPPFDSGSVEKASPELVKKVKASLLEYSRRAAAAK